MDGGEEGEAPQSNMVLRKRIKRIRAGMKKYNTQLDEVKRYLYILIISLFNYPSISVLEFLVQILVVTSHGLVV